MSSDRVNQQVVGADIFIVQKDLPQLPAQVGRLKSTLISNRGAKVWPGPTPPIEMIDVWRCRFRLDKDAESKGTQSSEILSLLSELEKAGFEWVHVEKLLMLNGKAGFSKADGEI
jgi:hypothetical protein